MNVQRTALLGLVLVFFSSNSLLAQESKSSSWWPFGSSSKTTETRSSSFFGASTTKPKSSASSMFKLPTWSKSKSKPKSKSTWNRMSSSTKKWMNSTADFLNPFNDGKPKVTQSHGYQTDYWSNRDKPKEEKSSMFGWMWQEEEDKNPASVNEFLAQPMPY